MGHQPHQLTQAENSRGQLKQAGEYYGSEDVFNAVRLRQRHDYDGYGTRSSADHARTAAKDRRHDAHNEGRVQPRKRRQSGEESEGNRFRDQCQCNGEPGEDLGLVVDLLFEIK